MSLQRVKLRKVYRFDQGLKIESENIPGKQHYFQWCLVLPKMPPTSSIHDARQLEETPL